MHVRHLLTWKAPIPSEPVAAAGKYYFSYVAGRANAIVRPFIANIQCHKSTGEVDGITVARYPTSSELRNMSYQALALGAVGLSYYTFFDYDPKLNQTNTDLSTRPELTTEFAILLDEIKALQGIYLNGLYSAIRMDNVYLFAASWLYQDRLVYLFVNGSEEEFPIDLAVPVSNENYSLLIEPKTPKQIDLSRGRFVTELDGEDVLVIEFHL